MEWVLQVVDEFDDVVAALRHRWLGLNGDFGVLWVAARHRMFGPRAAPCPADAWSLTE